MEHNKPHTRAATRAGVYPAPKPLYSPNALSFGTIEAGDFDFPLLAPSMRPVTASAAGITVTSLTRPPNAPSVGEQSSELPLLTQSDEDTDASGEATTSDEDGNGGWTPVTRKTSRSHRERGISSRDNHTINSISDSDASSVSDHETKSTVAHATDELSPEDLEALVRRHDAIANGFRAQIMRRATPVKSKEEVKSDVTTDVPNARSSASQSAESAPGPAPAPARASESRRATVETVEDEDDLISFSYNSAPGPSRNKGKGPDPGNWGNISSLEGFSERELSAQREALLNFEEIKRIKQEEYSLPADILVDFAPTTASTPKPKPRRKRSKSPKSRRAKQVKAEGPTMTSTPLTPAEKVQFANPEPSRCLRPRCE